MKVLKFLMWYSILWFCVIVCCGILISFGIGNSPIVWVGRVVVSIVGFAFNDYFFAKAWPRKVNRSKSHVP